MKQYIFRSLKGYWALLLAVAIVIGSFTVYAAPNIPQNVKVGLSYSSAANNNFEIKSDGGMKISVRNNTSFVDLFTHQAATGLRIRKDVYYNIVNNKETEINYTKAGLYSGEVIGPFHIQVGDIYPDMASAKQVADHMASLSQSVFLAYENGWRVWAQLYLEENDCLNQIQIFKAERPAYNFSVIAPDKRRVHVIDAANGKLLYILNAEQDIRFEPLAAANNAAATISFGTSRYRGSLYIRRIAAGHINVYNELPFEQYLYGVVPSEMPSSWHMEALKAQAVAARNWGMVNFGKHSADGFDICNTDHCQVYRGFSGENTRTNQAVDGTKGKLILHNDSLITAYYHSSSGGRTENSENVWSAPLPYAKAVDDKLGLGSPHDNWVKSYSKADIKAKLLANSIDLGDILDIIPLEYSINGRVTAMEVRGTKGSEKLLKGRFRSIMGSSEIRSMWYTVKTDADLFVKDRSDKKAAQQRAGNVYVKSASGTQRLSGTNNKVYVKDQNVMTSYNVIPEAYVFNGKGWGHGVGMSQYGAKGMAEAGFNFIQILEYYYTGTKVK